MLLCGSQEATIETAREWEVTPTEKREGASGEPNRFVPCAETSIIAVSPRMRLWRSRGSLVMGRAGLAGDEEQQKEWRGNSE